MKSIKYKGQEKNAAGNYGGGGGGESVNYSTITELKKLGREK